MAGVQIAVRVPQRLLAALDELVERGLYESRAAAVRAGIEAIAAEERRRRLDDAVAEGYLRLPPTPAETHAAFAVGTRKLSVTVDE